jgi:hypothetical protein
METPEETLMHQIRKITGKNFEVLEVTVDKRETSLDLLRAAAETGGNHLGHGWSQIVVFDVKMFVPAQNAHNLMKVLEHRHISARPPLMDRPGVDHAYLGHRYEKIKWYKQFPSYELTPTEPWMWAAHFPTRQRKKYEALLRLPPSEMFSRRKDHVRVHVKADEVLFKDKPRPIAAVEPVEQLFIGPWIHALMDRLHEDFSPQGPHTIRVGERLVGVVYGGSRNEDSLSDFGISACNSHFDAVLIVQGDDGLLVYPRTGRAVEFDMSMMDQSNGYEALKKERQAMRHLGVPQEIVRRLKEISKLPYLYVIDCKKMGTGAIRLKRGDWVDQKGHPNGGCFRDTGGPNTCSGNTLVLIMVTLQVFSENDGQLTADGFGRFGFRVKMQYHSNWIGRATFLKGWWLPSNYGLRWVPLPSRLAKIGKRMGDFKRFYRDLTHQEAARCIVAEGAKCYATALHLPLLGDYVSVGLDFDRPVVREIERGTYKVAKGTVTPIFERPEMYICQRYGVSEAELFEARTMVRELKYATFPVVLKHRVFKRLVGVDYLGK